MNYGAIQALRDVSFEVPRGRKLGLIGENGSGKSTLLKIIAGLVKPTSGGVTIQGNVLPLLELGAGFHPELSGWENVFLQGAVLGLSREQVRERLPEIVAFAELADFMDTPVKYYSAGMFVRLAFSVAIHCNPDILLVDEILSVGDPAFQEKSFHKMMEFVGGGRTLILVSHSLYAVREICDEALWLDEGRIREQGPARDVIHSYIVWNHERMKQFDSRKIEDRVCRLPAPPTAPSCRIVAIRFLDSTGAPCSRALSGGPLQIELDCACEEAIADAGCRIVWRSRHDTAILQFDSLAQGRSLHLPRGASVLRIGVESLAVRQAAYDVEAQLFYRPPGCAAAMLAEARSRLDVANPDGVATNYFLNVDWRFEVEETQDKKLEARG
ncbi:MAG: polysaccharide ABC transporter ATP-binding protein [Candidatus Sumerlaeia bacterium]|nr:polysaccharide ABC transporter ATP-binding protein [Candidatus Sumerlaeia bacterium]